MLAGPILLQDHTCLADSMLCLSSPYAWLVTSRIKSDLKPFMRKRANTNRMYIEKYIYETYTHKHIKIITYLCVVPCVWLHSATAHERANERRLVS
jgi:hypothetical protein